MPAWRSVTLISFSPSQLAARVRMAAGASGQDEFTLSSGSLAELIGGADQGAEATSRAVKQLTAALVPEQRLGSLAAAQQQSIARYVAGQSAAEARPLQRARDQSTPTSRVQRSICAVHVR